MVKHIMDKIIRRVNYKIFEKHVDANRNEYCINLALSDAEEVVYMCYDIQYDLGEYNPLPSEWVTEEDEREPILAVRDVYATLCVRDDH
jgi:hypothetical protein